MSNLTFRGTERVGEIVAAFPDASNLFKAYGIDFCCGGGRPLIDVLGERSIAAEPILVALHEAYLAAERRRGGRTVDWREVPLEALVDQILNVHHAYLAQELPVLSQFITKVHRVHGDRHPELRILDHLFHVLKGELQAHCKVEETELFEPIRQYARTGTDEDLAKALAVMNKLETEHQEVGRLLAALRKTADGYRLPDNACRTFTLTYQKLQELEADTMLHIHLENNILFPRLLAAANSR